jgi:alpha-tubulin suppressor-like RCC1 family protein
VIFGISPFDLDESTLFVHLPSMRTTGCRWSFAVGCFAGAALLTNLSIARAESGIVAWGDAILWQNNVPAGLTNVIAISAGSNHALALSADGQITAWGGPFSSTNIPPELTNTIAVAAGASHNLGIRSEGTVQAWGENTHGQLNVPLGLDDAVAVSAGAAHSLALRADGSVMAWGSNSRGQTDVPEGLTNVVAISAGAIHSLALLADGRVVGWGDPLVAMGLPDLTNAVAVSAGHSFNLALTSDGLVRAWPPSRDLLADRLSMVPKGLSNVIAVAAGTTHAVALRNHGTVTVWGHQTTTNMPPGLDQVVAIAAAPRYTLALRGVGAPAIASPMPNRSAPYGGTVYWRAEAVGAFPLQYQWRFNGTDLPGATNAVLALDNLQLDQSGAYSVVVSNALGTSISPDAMLEVPPISILSPPANQTPFRGGSATFTVTAVSPSPIDYQWRFNGTDLPGATNQVLLLNDIQHTHAGRYSVTLSNALGSLTSPEALLTVVSVAVWGSTDPGLTRPPAELTNVVSLASGTFFSLALKRDGTVTAWGANTTGVLDVPPLLKDVTAIAANYYSCLALQSDGKVVAWGNNANGQRAIPSDLSSVVAIAAGAQHNLALKSDGKVVGWGQSLALAGQPADLENVVAIAAGNRFSLALRGNGTVVSWGYDTSGTNVPPGLSDVIALAAGAGHALALRADGTVIGWGDNHYGQATVPPDLSNVVAISAGATHSLALKADGSLVLWGGQSPGQTELPPGLQDVTAIAAGYQHTSALVSDGPPFLLTAFASRSVVHGERTSLYVAASGLGPLQYQWRFNDSAIAGATNAVLTIDSVVFGNAGSYSVAVSNAVGTVVSPAATLEVVPMRIIAQPRGLYTFRGDDVTLTVTMEGPGPFDYQWRRSGADLPGANSPIFELIDAQPHQSDNYSVFVANAVGSLLSDSATVSIGDVAVWGEPYFDDVYGFTQVPPGLTNVMAVSAGAYHNLALKRDGTVVAWGDNRDGQSDPPADLNNVVSIAAGLRHNLALLANGTVVAWPTNDFATPPEGLDQVVAIAAGSDCSAALRADGTVVSWGYSDVGQTNLPPDFGNVVALAMFHYSSLALTRDEQVLGWGWNNYGQTTSPPLRDAVAIGVGTFFSAAVRANGSVHVWGDTGVPGPTPGLTDAIAVACGDHHALALTRAGRIVQWGYETSVPSRLRNVVAISAGWHHSVALVGDQLPTPFVLMPIPAWSSNAFTVALPSRSGKVYALEYLNSLTAPAWTALPLVAGHGELLSLTDPTGPHLSTRFYRVGQW